MKGSPLFEEVLTVRRGPHCLNPHVSVNHHAVKNPTPRPKITKAQIVQSMNFFNRPYILYCWRKALFACADWEVWLGWQLVPPFLKLSFPTPHSTTPFQWNIPLIQYSPTSCIILVEGQDSDYRISAAQAVLGFSLCHYANSVFISMCRYVHIHDPGHPK